MDFSLSRQTKQNREGQCSFSLSKITQGGRRRNPLLQKITSRPTRGILLPSPIHSSPDLDAITFDVRMSEV